METKFDKGGKVYNILDFYLTAKVRLWLKRVNNSYRETFDEYLRNGA